MTRVNTAELRTAATSHEERGQQWRQIASNPPNDPDAIAAAWGPIAHPTTEQLRVRNQQRAADAAAIQATHESLAEDLRWAADSYDRTDSAGADSINTAI